MSHRVVVNCMPALRGFVHYARCSCGWVGIKYPTRSQAEEDAACHEVAVVEVPRGKS